MYRDFGSRIRVDAEQRLITETSTMIQAHDKLPGPMVYPIGVSATPCIMSSSIDIVLDGHVSHAIEGPNLDQLLHATTTTNHTRL